MLLAGFKKEQECLDEKYMDYEVEGVKVICMPNKSWSEFVKILLGLPRTMWSIGNKES